MIAQNEFAVAIFADLYDTPKILIAQRGDQVILPMAKEGVRPMRGKKLKLWDVTPLIILGNERVRRIRHSNIFSGWVGTSVPDAYMDEWTKRYNTDPWRFRPFSWLQAKVNEGFFPEPLFRTIFSEAQKTGDPWVGTITWDQFDFPHSGLHKKIYRKEGGR